MMNMKVWHWIIGTLVIGYAVAIFSPSISTPPGGNWIKSKLGLA